MAIQSDQERRLPLSHNTNTYLLQLCYNNMQSVPYIHIYFQTALSFQQVFLATHNISTTTIDCKVKKEIRHRLCNAGWSKTNVTMKFACSNETLGHRGRIWVLLCHNRCPVNPNLYNQSLSLSIKSPKRTRYDLAYHIYDIKCNKPSSPSTYEPL